MRTVTFLIMIYGIALFSSCAFKEKEEISDPIDKKVAELMSKMTLEEKIGQMTQITVTALEKTGSPRCFG